MHHHNEYKWNHNFPQIARDSGFLLREAKSENSIIDWRTIGCLDVDQLLKENDFERLEHTLTHLSDAPLGSLLKNSILDPTIYKYFIAAQLSIQYLVFCKQFLDRSVSGMRIALVENENEIAKLQKSCRRKDGEILNLHKKLNQNRSTQIVPCTKCTKNFNSAEMLNIHMMRKHRATLDEQKKDHPVEDDQNLINAIKLELEVKSLKEKLIAMEKELGEAKAVTTVLLAKPEVKMIEKAIQTNFEVKEKDDVEETLRNLLDQQKQAFDDWRSSESLRYEKELSEMNRKLNETLNEVKNYQKTIEVISSCKTKDAGVETEYWKKKFDELEKTYAENQEKITNTIHNLDKKYEDNLKVTKSEPSVPKSTPPKSNIPRFTRSQSRVVEDIPQISTKDETEDDEDTTTSQTSSTTTSTSSSKSESYRQNKMIEEILSKNISKPTLTRSEPKIQIRPQITRNDIEKLLSARLAQIGIVSRTKQLSGPEYSSALVSLTEQRETTKSKFKSFFLHRNTISNQIDRIVEEKLEKNTNSNIHAPRTTTAEIVKREEEPLVADHKPSTSRQSIDEKFAMYKLVEEDENQDQDEIVAVKPKPAPRKRVIFELDKPKIEAQPKIDQKPEDTLSDWDVSSFSDLKL